MMPREYIPYVPYLHIPGGWSPFPGLTLFDLLLSIYMQIFKESELANSKPNKDLPIFYLFTSTIEQYHLHLNRSLNK